MVAIGGNVSGLVASISQAQQSVEQLSSSMESMQDASALVTGAVAAAAAAFAGLAIAGIQGNAEAQTAMAKTEAVIRSTGGVAGVAADHLAEMSVKMEQLSGMAAESVQQGGNLLLTFTNIRNVAGKGNDVFDQTVKIMADMAAMMGKDTSGAAMMLGKALNDPIVGIAALSKNGVSFTASQKELIKSLVESNHVLEAQKIILGEVNKEFGGQAAAMGATFAGAMERVGNALGDVGEAIAAPIFEPLINGMNMAQTALLALADAIGEKGLARAILDIVAPTEAARIALVAFTGAIVAMMIPSIMSAVTAIMTLISSFAAIAPLAARGAAVALVAYGIYRAWEALGPLFSSTWDRINQATAASLGYLSSAMQLIVARVQWMAHSVSSLVQAGFGVARSFIQNVMANIVLLVHKDIQAISQLFGYLPQTMLAAFNRATAYADANFLQPIMRVLTRIGKGFQAVAQYLGVTFPERALAGLSQLGSGIASFGRGVANTIAAPFTAARDSIRDTWASLTRTTTRAPMPVMPAVAPTIEAAGEAAKKAKEKLSEAQKEAQRFADALSEIVARERLFGQSSDLVERRINLVKDRMVELVKDGASPTSEAIKRLRDEMDRLLRVQDSIAASDKLKKQAEDQRATMKQYEDALQSIAGQEKVFGRSSDTVGQSVAATKQAIISLIGLGVDPASDAILKLSRTYEYLTSVLRNVKTEEGLRRNTLADVTSNIEQQTEATVNASEALAIAEASIRGVRSVMRELSQALGEQTAKWTDYGLEVAQATAGVAASFLAGPVVGIITAIAAGLALLVKGSVMLYNQLTGAQREAEAAQVKAGKEALDAMRKQEESVQAIGYAYTELIMAAQDAGRALTLDELGGQLEKATEKMRELRMEGVSPLSESYQALRAIQADIEAQFRNVANASGQTAMAFRAVGKAGAEAAKQVSAMIEQANSAVESAGSAIGDYLAGAAEGIDLSDFETNFADAIRGAIIGAIQKAVTASVLAKGSLSTLIQAFTQELSADRVGAAEALIPKIAQQAEAEARKVGPVIERLRGAIDSAFVPGKGTIGPADIVAPIRDQAQEIKQTVQDIKRATETLAPSPAMRPGEISAYLPQGRESRQVVINVTGNTVLNDRDADRLGNALVGSMRRAGVAFA